MGKKLLSLLGISVFSLLTLTFLLHSKNAQAAAANHIVISEIQVNGATTSDDFVELYNPTSFAINMEDMRLVKRTSTGATDEDIVVFSASDVIPAHGYYLWCNTVLSGTLTCDKTSTDTISNNNSVGLRNEPANTGSLIDSVTFGTPDFPLGEGASLTAPIASNSVERKANSSSTGPSMGAGGLDEFMGNAEDTDNNSSDFIVRSVPQPQNTSSLSEPIATSPTQTPTPSVATSPTPTLTPSPTNEPSPTPTITPTSTPIPSPTLTPTMTPTPTPSNTPTPTLTPTATPTTTPSSTPAPTITIAPTISPTSTPVPSPTMTPTPTPVKDGRIIANGPLFKCTLNYRTWILFGKVHFFPYINCEKTAH